MGLSNSSCENKTIKEITNLRNIKSIYLINNIFFLLDEKRKLNIIIYNKKYQNQLKINVEYYKKISGRYIKGNKNGISKEYILGTNILVFEGKYLNGKRNGKGKEFYNDKIKFEGEYSNGRIIKGIGYNSRGKVILTIKKNGKYKEYYDNGHLKFDGMYLYGRKWDGRGYDDKGREIYILKKWLWKNKRIL